MFISRGLLTLFRLPCAAVLFPGTHVADKLARITASVARPLWRLAGDHADVSYRLTFLHRRHVQEGMKIGYVTDLFGKTVWEARAPSSGVVLYVCAIEKT